MLIKFKIDDPLSVQIIELLKLQFRTSAASKAAKAAIQNYYNLSRKNEILEIQNDSMSAEIDRLRELLELQKSTSISTKIAHLRSQRS